MSQFDDAFDKYYKAMYARMHEPYEKYEVKWEHGETLADALMKSDLSVADLEELHEELQSLLSRKGSIRCDAFGGDLSEGLRFIRYSAYEVPSIGWFDDYGYKPITTKKQYKSIDEEIVQAIMRKQNYEQKR